MCPRKFVEVGKRWKIHWPTCHTRTIFVCFRSVPSLSLLSAGNSWAAGKKKETVGQPKIRFEQGEKSNHREKQGSVSHPLLFKVLTGKKSNHFKNYKRIKWLNHELILS
jgi:hypothetical protein